METLEPVQFLIEYYQHYEIKDKILAKLKEDWSVLYTLSYPAQLTSNPLNTYTTVPLGGTFTYFENIPVTMSAPQVIPVIEVCYIKKNWNTEPCPRCSYPFPDPDRIDREV